MGAVASCFRRRGHNRTGIGAGIGGGPPPPAGQTGTGAAPRVLPRLDTPLERSLLDACVCMVCSNLDGYSRDAVLGLPVELINRIFSYLAEVGAASQSRLKFFAGTRLSDICVSTCDIDDQWMHELARVATADSIQQINLRKCQRVTDSSLNTLPVYSAMAVLTLV